MSIDISSFFGPNPPVAPLLHRVHISLCGPDLAHSSNAHAHNPFPGCCRWSALHLTVLRPLKSAVVSEQSLPLTGCRPLRTLFTQAHPAGHPQSPEMTRSVLNYVFCNLLALALTILLAIEVAEGKGGGKNSTPTPSGSSPSRSSGSSSSNSKKPKTKKIRDKNSKITRCYDEQ